MPIISKNLLPIVKAFIKNHADYLTLYGAYGNSSSLTIGDYAPADVDNPQASRTPKNLAGLTGWTAESFVYGLRNEERETVSESSCGNRRLWVAPEKEPLAKVILPSLAERKALKFSTASKNSTDSKLEGAALFTHEGITYLVSTNRHIATRVPVEVEGDWGDFGYIPASLVEALDSRYAKELHIYEDRTSLLLEDEGQTARIESTYRTDYPRVLAVFPVATDYRAVAVASELVEAIEAFNLPRNGSIYLDGYGVKCDGSPGRQDVMSGYMPSMQFNQKYITGYAKLAGKGARVAFEVPSKVKGPALMKFEGYQMEALVMPIIKPNGEPVDSSDNPVRANAPAL